MNEVFDEMNGLIFLYKLQPSNCKGFKNTNLVISSKNWSPKAETFFLEAVDFTGVDVLEEYT